MGKKAELVFVYIKISTIPERNSTARTWSAHCPPELVTRKSQKIMHDNFYLKEATECEGYST